MEKIGQVILDDTLYPGKDLYTDGADVQTATVNTINVYDVMKHNTVVVTKDAVASIEEVYA